MTPAYSTLCFSSKKHVLILAIIFVQRLFGLFLEKSRNSGRLTCCRSKTKEQSFMDTEKIFVWNLDQNKQFEKENVFKPILSTYQRFREYDSKQDFEEKLYWFVEGHNCMYMTALWKRIFWVAEEVICRSKIYTFLQQKLWTIASKI